MAMDREDLEAITAAINKGFQARGTTAAGSSGGEKTVSKDTFDSIFTKFGKGLFKGAEQIVTRGGGRLADVSDQFSSTLGGLIGYVENTNDVFQSLSKVGAGFDADLGAIRQSAAATRLPLDAFAGLIAKNTAELAGFSGGVNAGAKRFTQLSQSMFDSNLIENFMDLGLTVEESNEFLMRNMAMDRRRARLQGLTNQQQVQSALELAKSMDVMAKLTGKSVQEQQDSMTARMREGATQARLRLLESQGVTGASEAYKNAQSALEGSPKVVGDLLADLTQTGVPMTEATKNFAATNKEAYALLQQSAAATKRGDAVQAQKLAQQAAAATAKFAGSQQGLTLATLAQVSDIAKGQADRLEEVGPIIDSIAEHSDKLAKELGRTPTIFETYNDMLSKAVDIQGKQLGGTLPGQGAQQSVREGQLGLANIATTFNKELGKALSGSEVANGIFEGLTKFITESGDKISKVAGGAVNLAGGTTLDDVSSASNNPNVKRDANTLSDPTATADEKSSAQQRLIDANILNADGSLNVNVVNETFNQSFERLQEQLKNAEPRERDTILGKINKLIGGGRAIGGGVQQGMAYKVGELGPETFLAGMDGAIIPNMKAMLNRMPDIAGQLQAEMQAMGAPMSQAAKSAAVEMQSSTSVEQKLDILNQTMMQLVNINTTQARTGEKALRQNRSVGNLMGGLGRA